MNPGVEIEPKNEFPAEIQANYSLVIPSNEILAAQMKMAEQISSVYNGRRPILLTVLKGAERTTDEMKPFLTIDYDEASIGLKSYHASQTSGDVKITSEMTLDPSGRDVLISEDVFDTGLTMDMLVKLLKERGAADVRIAVLVEKDSQRLVEGIKPHFVGIAGVRGFIVGHGFDDFDLFRELDHIYVKNNPDFDPRPFLNGGGPDGI